MLFFERVFMYVCIFTIIIIIIRSKCMPFSYLHSHIFFYSHLRIIVCLSFTVFFALNVAQCSYIHSAMVLIVVILVIVVAATALAFECFFHAYFFFLLPTLLQFFTSFFHIQASLFLHLSFILYEYVWQISMQMQELARISAKYKKFNEENYTERARARACEVDESTQSTEIRVHQLYRMRARLICRILYISFFSVILLHIYRVVASNAQT